MNKERLMKIVLGVHTSEKTHRIAEKHKQFVFKVARDAHKKEIGQAVETLFDVKVSSVHVCHVKPRKRYFRQIAGKIKGWKKAYVALEEGYDIQFTEAKA